MRRRLVIVVAVMATLTLTIPAGASGHSFPETIPLPNGFQPEGVASGNGTELYAGSLATGAIYKADARTGAGELINEAGDFDQPRMAVGLKHDSRSDVLWVAGGFMGEGYVYDADTGESLAVVELTAPGTFINDVVVTRDAAYFTDSFQPVVFKVPLDERGLPAGSAEALPLTGDFISVPGEFNSNGIDATPNGQTLILVNSVTGTLYTVDPDSGAASAIDLGGEAVPSGDGILLDGRSLYVVQNLLNQIAVVELSPDLASGTVDPEPITSDAFAIPTTAAEFGSSLYAVNARFDVAPPGVPAPDVEFDIVQVGKR